MTRIGVADLVVTRGGRRILDGVSTEVRPGEWLGVIGPNGAGKSTLLSAIAGVVPSEGVVTFGDRDLRSMTSVERARTVALVTQEPELPPGMTVIDYVMLGRTPHVGRFSAESAADIAAANRAVDDLGLVGFELRAVDELSGGERQRVVMARAIAQATPVLLLDEPTSALDVGVRIEVLDHIDSIRRSCGLTVVSAVHDLTLAAQFCDRLVMVSGGRVVAEGDAAGVLTPESISKHYGATVRVVDDELGGVVVIPVRDHRGRAAQSERRHPDVR